MDQKSFYNLLLARKIIRPDAYINSYDDALRLILLQISAAAAVVNPAIIKAITENMVQWQFSTDEAPQVIPCVAFIGGHAVLVVDVVKAESGDIDIKVIDPARRGASARYVIPRERVKKFGGFVWIKQSTTIGDTMRQLKDCASY